MKFLKQHTLPLFYLSLWGMYFAFFWARALFLDKAGNFVAGHVNMWGDWAAHFTMATALEQRGVFHLGSPFLVSAKFSYPFIADLISAVLLRLTDNIFISFLLPSFVFSVLFVTTLFLFYKTVFHSPKIAIVASLIFLLNGGVGFYYFARDIVASPQPLQVLINPPHEYTRLDKENIKWILVIDSMMIPQRAFLLGFPLALIALILIWHLFFEKKNMQHRYHTLVICLLLGVLPIVHTHSFLAVFVIVSFWCVTDILFASQKERLRRVVRWGSIALGTSVIALPLILHYFTGNVTGHFFHFYPGWLAQEYGMNWLVFWWKNWGITPLISIIGWLLIYKYAYRPHGNKILPWLFLPFFTLFIAANLFLFQPFAWDNTKIIIWTSLGWSGLAAYLLSKLGRQWLKRMVATILFTIMIASGAIDAYRILRVQLHSFEMYSAADLEMAQWVKENTPVDSLWLTSDQHNHWLYNLTGRQPMMAYRGWLWTHGYTYQPVERDVSLIFSGSPAAEKLLKEYDVEYVVIGLSELENFSANEAFFASRFKMVKSNLHTRIYAIK